jgi:mRNA-degrading endonuclease RelE of RelBE toxin-antitoxin system
MKILYSSELKRNLRRLVKKYRHIRSDIKPIIKQLQLGEILGDQIPRVRYVLYKVRIRNTDVQRGKSVGYRLIYCFQDTEQIVLVTIYSKFDQNDVSSTQIYNILEEFEE